MNERDTAVSTHLHVHSHYSLLEGIASPQELAARAAADGMAALALTDSNNLYGAVAFAKACRAAGLQAITGMTVHIAPPPEEMPDDLPQPGRLTLLALGPEGYQSLCRLSARLQAYPEREVRLQRGLSWDDLKTYHDGLICIEAGMAGWLARFLRVGQRKAASRYAGRLGAIFPDRCYVGLELYGSQDATLAREMAQIGERFGMAPVVAQPVFALEAEDLALRPLLAAMSNNSRLGDVAELPPGYHWLNPADLADRFAAFPEALANIGHIVRQCRPALPDGRPIWPVLDLPQEETAETMLRQMAEAGLAERRPSSAPHNLPADAAQLLDYDSRLQNELAAIIQHGFAPLFLLVADLVRFAREHDVPVSTRGSVANSLVAYALGITTVDPIEHGLLFERFLNPARANLPDIDLDFCSRRRDEVLTYAREKYGAERVALVGSMNTLQPKSAVREVAKAYGIPETRIKKLSALLPRHWHPDPRRREALDVEAILADVPDETEQTAIRQAFRLIGQPHHLSLHPGGIVITPQALTDIVPVQWATKGYLATQYDFRDVEAIGLQKIDLLGIRALTVLADTAVAIRTTEDPTFTLADIPLDDEETGALLARGDTIGVFQCESSGAQRTLRQLRARKVRDLAVANAFFKPGPATGGMAKSFIRRYRGEESVSYLHPALQPILQPTQGVLLFQEQILRLAVEIAGLSWEQADHLRRGMSKFQSREMAAMRLAFVLGCQRAAPDGPALTPQQAETLWEQVMAFAGYGFNQGHATAYADVSYRSAYLKTHYPAEFLCARLMDQGGFHHPAIYMAEARRLGIAVHPPHINVSGRKVTLTDEEGRGKREERGRKKEEGR
ncbi:MAG: DNA polymerase III subunit alpha, partial [Ardenticatenaceae bacterium]|nr:DNA polymerase III subunit alpha [Ardenticatenaceae bacterium]